MSDLLQVACVLRSGGDFKIFNVLRLRDQVMKNLSGAVAFYCLTDNANLCMDPIAGLNRQGVHFLPLRCGYPGWWSKIELFGVFNNCLYFDLDTTIKGDLSWLAERPNSFMALRDLGEETRNPYSRMGSAVMRWSGDYSFISQRFAESSRLFTDEYTTPGKWGDQGFIQDALEKNRRAYAFLQDKHPGRIVSYKLDILRPRTELSDVRVVCFHGKPRPWDNGVLPEYV